MSKRKVSKQAIHKLFAYRVMNHGGDRAAGRFARIAYADRFASELCLRNTSRHVRAFRAHRALPLGRYVIAIFLIRASRARRSRCVNGESLFTAFRTLRYSADALQNHRLMSLPASKAWKGQVLEVARARCVFLRANPPFRLFPPDTLLCLCCATDLSLMMTKKYPIGAFVSGRIELSRLDSSVRRSARHVKARNVVDSHGMTFFV